MKDLTLTLCAVLVNEPSWQTDGSHERVEPDVRRGLVEGDVVARETLVL